MKVVKEYTVQDSCLMLEPRGLSTLDTISARTLKDMDRAIQNFKRGQVSKIIDLSKLE